MIYISKILLKIYIWLHNYCYKKISTLVVKTNNGIHPKHQIMHYHQFFIDNINNTDTILDLGCGNGFLTSDVATKAQKIIGIDQNPENIKIAKNKYQNDKKFDKIILSNVLEHIENRVDFLNDLHQLSDTILLRVPMIDRDWLSVYKKENGFDYKLDKTHYIEYTLKILKKELSQSGWTINSYSIQFGEFWGVIKTPIIK